MSVSKISNGVEYGYTGESSAHAARRTFIIEGRSVSLIALDPSRDLYVFDVYN